jgi:hypothetical protein
MQHAERPLGRRTHPVKVTIVSEAQQTCFVHIGVPKTGTTLLQRFFFENREALLRHGVLYPDVSLRGFGHHDFAFLIAGGYPDWATPQPRTLPELAAQLRNDVVRIDPKTVLLSSEDFYLFPAPGTLLKLLKEVEVASRFRIALIVYLRRQDLAHESWYNQTVKAQGATHRFDQSVRDTYALWDYEANLKLWADVFGTENIMVRPFEQAQFAGGSLIDDFLAVLQLSGVGFKVPPGRINTSLNKDLLEFQRLFNALPMATQDKRRFHRQLMELSMAAQGNGRFNETPFLDYDGRKALLETYEAGNRVVARTYLQRDRLFRDPVEDGPAPVDTHLTPEKLVSIFGALIGSKG